MKTLFVIILSFGFSKAYGLVGEKIQTGNLDFYKSFETKNHQAAGGDKLFPYLIAQNPPEIWQSHNNSPPLRELTWDMIDRLLTAEAALQNNNPNLALEKYMEIARETWDSSISARAVQIALLAKNANGEDRVEEATQLHNETDHSNIKASQILSSFLVHSGNIDGSVDHLKQVIEKMPNDSPLATKTNPELTQIPLPNPEEKFNGLQQIKPSFKNIIGPGFQFAINILSKFIKGEHQETAFNTIRQLTDEYEKENVEAQMALAIFFTLAERYDEALNAVESIAPFSSGNTEIAIFHSQLYRKNKKDQEAVDVLEKFLRYYPNSEKIRITYVATLTSMEQYEKAANGYKELLRRYPQNDRARYFFSLTLWYTGQVDEAKQQFEKILNSKQPFIADLANYSLGQIAESKNQYNEAVKFYKSIITNQDYHFNAQIKIAGIITKKGNLQGGRTHLHSLRAKDSKQFMLLLSAEANMLIDAGEYEEMKAFYKKILRLQPDNLLIMESYIESAKKIGQLDMGLIESHFKKLLNFNPNNANILNFLGYILIEETDRHEEGYWILNRALQIEPNSAHISDSVGWALFRLERYEEALEHLERAKSMYFPQVSAEIESHIGEVHWTLGNKEEARRIWNEALDKNLSDKEYLIKTMQRLDQNE